MADTIVWIDGFDHYAVASQGIRKYNANFSSADTGRFGGQAAQITSLLNLEKVFSTTSAAWRVGFAAKLNTFGGNAFQMIRLRDGASDQVELGVSSTRQVRVTRNGTQLAVSTQIMNMSQWYYLEWYVVISDSISTNQCVVMLDGVEVINLSATSDTKNTSNAYADRVIITGTGSNNHSIDDLVVSMMDTTTSPTFLGDLRVQTLFPNADGNYSQFTGSDGNSVNNYLLVDDTTSVNDADYTGSSTVGHKDSYNIESLTFTPTSIKAAKITSCMRRDDAGAKTGRLFFRTGGSDFEGSDITPASSGFVFEGHIAEVNPDTTVAWTASDITSLEIGIKVEA